MRAFFVKRPAICRLRDRIKVNNVVKEIFACIGHHNSVLARCDSIIALLNCQGVWIKRAHNFLFPKPSFRIQRATVLGMFKGSAVIPDAIRRSFLTKSAKAAMFTSVRVEF
jgi:hypothetical protein